MSKKHSGKPNRGAWKLPSASPNDGNSNKTNLGKSNSAGKTPPSAANAQGSKSLSESLFDLTNPMPKAMADIEAPQWDTIASFGTSSDIGLTFREDSKFDSLPKRPRMLSTEYDMDDEVYGGKTVERKALEFDVLESDDENEERQSRDGLDSIEFVSHSSGEGSDSDNDDGDSENEGVGEFGESMEDDELSNSLDYYDDIDDEADGFGVSAKSAKSEKRKKNEAADDALDFDDDFLAQAVAKKKQKQQPKDAKSAPSIQAFSTATEDSARALALEVTRAKHTLNQHYLWDQFVGVRLGLQPAMTAVASLPAQPKEPVHQDGTILRFGEKTSKPLQKASHGASLAVRGLLWDLMSLQAEILGANKNTQAYATPPTTFASLGENDESNVGEQSGEKLAKERVLTSKSDQLWSLIEKSQSNFGEYERDTIEKWNTKLMYASADFQKKFKSFNQSINVQVDNIIGGELSYKKLLSKSQQREKGRILGEPEDDAEEIENKSGLVRDENVYDDTEFYTSLLKDLSQTTVSSVSDMMWNQNLLSQTQLQKRKNKKKQMEMKGGNKGKRIDYSIHTKLTGLMAPNQWAYPEIDSPMTEALFKSIMGKTIASS